MNEDTFNISLRSFLKKVGIHSQREIENAVKQAIADGTLKGNESFPAVMTLEVGALKLKVSFDDTLKLE